MARARFVLLAVLLAGGLAYARFHTSNSQGSLTGPVLGSDETIVGRVLQDGKAWILTAKDVLVRVDIGARAHARFPVGPLGEDEHLWGLASVGGDTLWSIAGRSTLVQLSGEG